ncbi:MAG: pyridoxamine 5'-phosphate oxidase family protein [Myxococcota bacterium]
MSNNAEPESSRPHMPGYGILPADQGRGLLPWSWASDRFSESKNFWLSTCRPDGRPHAMAVWGVWLQESRAFYFSTGSETLKARNLAANPACVITTSSADVALIVEGVADRVEGAAIPPELKPAYEAKYGMAYPPDSSVFAVHPRLAFGIIEDAAEFPGSATRWKFPAP